MHSAASLATHSVAFCIGAATVSVLLNFSSLTSVDSSADIPPKETKTLIPTSQSEYIDDMLPTLPIRLFRPNDNLLIAFNTQTKNPAFVMERFPNNRRGMTAEPPSRKNKRFFEEKSLPAHHRSRNHHYRGSGYDRGHLAAVADFKSDSEVNDSFSLTNVSPQLPTFNRSVWLRVEEFVRSTAKDEEEKDENVETWAITGPLWLPATSLGRDKFRFSYEAIGRPPSLVHVPTHFFKVVVVVSATTATDSGFPFKLKKFAAFVIPHSVSDEKSSRLRLVDCVVRLSDLEAVSGVEFFPSLFGFHAGGSDDVPLNKELADALTDDVRDSAKSNYLLLESGAKRDGGTLDVELSKRRQKRVKQLLGSLPLFQHLCNSRDRCLASLSK